MGGRESAKTQAAIILAALIVAAAAGIGIGWGFGTTVSPAPATTVQAPGPYQLTLVEIMGTAWNSTMMQPKFYVLGADGLESSAAITVPANRTIQLTIISYDTPTPNSSAQYAQVKGTVGGDMRFYNGTIATGAITNETMAQMMSLGTNVTSVPAGSLAHTFSIPELGINVPVVGGSTEIAYLYFAHAGTYTWICETPCGFGPNGSEGAMSTPGWMTGQLTVR